MDKLCLLYLKSMLGVKSSTCNYVVWGALGVISPSVKWYIKILCYYDRLRNLPDCMIVKRVYNEALHLHEQGFNTWVSKVWEISRKYKFNLEIETSSFWHTVKNHITEHYRNHWLSCVYDIAANPILRTYTLLKTNFKF